MESADDKHWATRYLLDPLNAPDPSAETGPGTSFRPDSAAKASPASKLPSPPTSPSSSRVSKNPFRKNSVSSPREPGMISPIGRSTSLSSKVSPATTRTTELPYRPSSQHGHSRDASGNYPTPPPRQSPTHRQEAFGEYNSGSAPKNPPGSSPNTDEAETSTNRRRRGSSLTQRYPGDKSHLPLETLSREKAKADKSSYITRKHHITPDTIDALDTIGPDGKAYHHSGPYDATLFARNNSYLSSPLEALSQSNAEAIKATPRDKLQDSIRGHRPLDGVATYPPGTTDRNGQTYNYTEGENMMIGSGPGDRPEGGAYKRWPGLDYTPEDVKGKSEPSYTVEKSLKEMDEKQRAVGANGEIEMTSNANRGVRPGSSGRSPDLVAGGATGAETVDRSGNKRLSGGIKKRIGSIKRHLGSGEA